MCSNRSVKGVKEVELYGVQFMGEESYSVICLKNISQIQWQKVESA